VKIFVGYGYHDHDRWIEELVFPLIESFGCEVVHGKIMVGDVLSTNVRNTLLSCDALIGFLTRREPSSGDKWTTHRWVIEELAAAYDQIPTIEIRESNVDPQGGMLGSQQRIDFDETRRDACLVHIAQAISVLRSDFLKRKSVKNARLGPQQFINDIKRLIIKPGFICQYRVRRDSFESPYQPADIRRVAGGLYVWLPGVADTDLVEISVTYGAQAWRSDFEPVDAIAIDLSEE
jgi:hypothetical protein